MNARLDRISNAKGARRRCTLLRRMQIALKPTSKTFGLHGIFVSGKGLKDMIAYSAFKRVQVDTRAYWRDAGEPHRGPALRTGGALNCSEWNDGRQGLRLGHDASPRMRREHNTLCHR
jgi:hypothetical protein